jgi:uncharacterized protein YciU (UPF0263 family)
MPKTCDTCDRPLDRDEQGTCPECKLVALINLGCDEDEPESDDGDEPGHSRSADPDDYVQIEADDPPTEPDEEDLVTPDHRRFFRLGFEHRGPAVVVAEEDDWRREVKRYMLAEGWYPNVWFISDHGNYHLLSLNGES